jgi:hypothetical protein
VPYYYFDNCDGAGFRCSIVDYHRFLGPPTDGTKATWVVASQVAVKS